MSLVSCFSDLKGSDCQSDEDCFTNETCIAGSCTASGGADTGVEEDTDDVGDEADDTEMMDTVPSGEGFISGRVLDRATVMPIASALVTSNPPSEQLLTDDQGRYRLSALIKVGESYTIIVERDGYTTATSQVVVEAGGSRNIDILMSACPFAEEMLCDGLDDDCDGEIDEDVANACGGCMELEGLPETTCGTCNSGVYSCAADSESVTCLGDGGEEARNVCGGCTPINAAPEDPCGRCDSGTLACADDNEELECVGDQGDAAENACGGCAELDGLPGDACGVCGVYVCAEGDNDQVACMPGGLELCDEEGGHLGHDDDCDEMIDEGCP